MESKKAFRYLLFLFLFVQSIKSYTQVKISGPECVLPGVEYQYNFYSKGDKESEMNVCVEGGFIAGGNSTCYEVKEVNYFRIVWNDDIIKGKISITSPFGNGSFRVRQTRALQGGKIDSLSKLQLVEFSTIPQPINCAATRGGNCSPSFVYQWEQSNDNLHWTEVNNAVSKNLSFSGTLNSTAFFRRKIFETVSNSIAYSDVAIVVVNTISGTN